jgi:hypothetical protein
MKLFECSEFHVISFFLINTQVKLQFPIDCKFLYLNASSASCFPLTLFKLSRHVS